MSIASRLEAPNCSYCVLFMVFLPVNRGYPVLGGRLCDHSTVAYIGCDAGKSYMGKTVEAYMCVTGNAY